MIRRVCVRRGHRWLAFTPLPVQSCARWFCRAQRVAPWVSSEPLRAGLERAIIDAEKRRLRGRTAERR